MRIVKWILGSLIVIIAVLGIIGMLLPRDVTVARSIEIDAAAADIFPFVNDLRAGVDWSPWLSQDPETRLIFSEVATGKGATLDWASDNGNVGSGRMEITDVRPNERLEVALDFGAMGMADAFWDFVEVSGKTTVTWGFATDMGAGPAGRWMGLMMDSWIGADYQRGLENLKALVEAG